MNQQQPDAFLAANPGVEKRPFTAESLALLDGFVDLAIQANRDVLGRTAFSQGDEYRVVEALYQVREQLLVNPPTQTLLGRDVGSFIVGILALATVHIPLAPDALACIPQAIDFVEQLTVEG